MPGTQRITPHLWFDKEALEAASFYTTLFPNSRIKSRVKLQDTPSGSVDLLTIDIMGQEFSLFSAGPHFRFNPSISFLVACPTKDEVDRLWRSLAQGGQTLMELGEYPFSPRYGWVQDRYGLSWQLMFTPENPSAQAITPSFLFVGKQCGNAEAAITLHTSVFPNSAVRGIMRYGKGEEPDREGTVKHAAFVLANQPFAAMDSAYPHQFAFNEAISFMIHCDTQDEIDYYWGKLSAVPEAEQCGWLKDRFGISWQVVPTALDEMITKGDPASAARVTQAVLRMKKLDIAELQRAFAGQT